MSKTVYRYVWGNNPKRETMRGRKCCVIGRLSKNSCVIEFLDNGQKEIVSRNALRRVNSDKDRVEVKTSGALRRRQVRREGERSNWFSRLSTGKRYRQKLRSKRKTDE